MIDLFEEDKLNKFDSISQASERKYEKHKSHDVPYGRCRLCSIPGGIDVVASLLLKAHHLIYSALSDQRSSEHGDKQE